MESVLCVNIPGIGMDCGGVPMENSNPYGVIGSPTGTFGNGGFGPGGYGSNNPSPKLPWHLWLIMGGLLFVAYKVIK